MAAKTRYLYVIAHDYVPLVDNVIDMYGGHPKVIAQKYDSYMSAAIDIELYGTGLIIYALTDMDHIKNIVSFTEGIKKFVKNKKVRIVVLHSIDHPKLKKLLRKIGCAEIFKTSVSPKFIQKLLEKYLGKAKSSDDALEDVVVVGSKDSGDQAAPSGPATSVLDISNEMPDGDEVVGADEDVNILPEENKSIEEKIVKSEIKNKVMEKPAALDTEIPYEKLDDEQKKIRDFYSEICPFDEDNETGDKKDSFGDIEDPKKKASFMDESKDSKKPITVWTREREILVHAKLNEVDPDNNIYSISFGDDKDTKTLVGKIKNSELDVLFVKLDISRGSIFFDIRDPKLNEGTEQINVTIPERMWRVDRRRYHRLQFPKNVENTVAIKVEGYRDGEEIERRIVNLGAEGACLGVFQNEADFFKPGTFIENFHFGIKGQELDCCAQVVWVEQFEGDSFLSVGIQFLGLDDDFIETINLFILEQTFEFWEKYYV
jgi:c-di-GMP-binding flagellar brake protein YcgR